MLQGILDEESPLHADVWLHMLRVARQGGLLRMVPTDPLQIQKSLKLWGCSSEKSQQVLRSLYETLHESGQRCVPGPGCVCLDGLSSLCRVELYWKESFLTSTILLTCSNPAISFLESCKSNFDCCGGLLSIIPWICWCSLVELISPFHNTKNTCTWSSGVYVLVVLITWTQNPLRNFEVLVCHNSLSIACFPDSILSFFERDWYRRTVLTLYLCSHPHNYLLCSSVAIDVLVSLLSMYTNPNSQQAQEDAKKCIVDSIKEPKTYLFDRLLLVPAVQVLKNDALYRVSQ